MFGLFKFRLFKKDEQLEILKKQFRNKILVEPLKTKVNRHKIFWIGRSKYDDRVLRVGVEFSGGRKYFFDWDDFQNDARCSSYQVMTIKEANELEQKIKEKRKK